MIYCLGTSFTLDGGSSNIVGSNWSLLRRTSSDSVQEWLNYLWLAFFFEQPVDEAKTWTIQYPSFSLGTNGQSLYHRSQCVIPVFRRHRKRWVTISRKEPLRARRLSIHALPHGQPEKRRIRVSRRLQGSIKCYFLCLRRCVEIREIKLFPSCFCSAQLYSVAYQSFEAISDFFGDLLQCRGL